MTACKDSLNGKKAVSATLAGVLAVGMVPAAAFADADQADTTDEAGIALQAQLTPKQAFESDKATVEAVDATGATVDATKAISFTEDGKAKYVTVKSVTPVGATEKIDITADNFDVVYEKDGATTTASQCTGVGSYSVTITGKAGTDYATWTKTISWKVAAAPMADVTLCEGDNVADSTFVYSGAAADVNPVYDGEILATNKSNADQPVKTGSAVKYSATNYADVHYYDANNVAISDAPTNAGKYFAKVTVKAVSSDAIVGTKTVAFEIGQLDLSTAAIQVNDIQYVEGNPTWPSIAKINGVDYSTSALKDKVVLTRADGQEYDKLGTYTETVKLSDSATATDKANIVNSQDVSFNVVTSVISHDSFKIKGTEMAGEYSVDLSASPTGAFDEDDITITGVSDSDEYAIDVVDENGKSTTLAEAMKKAGEYTVTVRYLAAENEYAKGGSATTKVTVVNGTMSNAITVVATYDGEVVNLANLSEEYTGENLLDKLDIKAYKGFGTKKQAELTEGTDYEVVIKSGKDVVTEAVNAGTYSIEIKGITYTGKEEGTLTISQVKPTEYRVAMDQVDENKAKFLAYTGQAITPEIEYVAKTAADGTKTWKTVPAESYKLAYKMWNDKTNQFEAVDSITDKGYYQVTLSASDQDVNKNFDLTGIDEISADKTVYSKRAGANAWVADGTVFTDVKPGDWFYDYVNKANANGFVYGLSGTTMFAPNAAITRADVAVIVFRMANGTGVDDGTSNTEISYDTPFTDVNGHAYYAKAVQWAAKAGIVSGYGDGTFKPEQNISREEFACLLAKYAKSQGKFVTSDGSDLAALPDAGSVHDWAKENVAWAVEQGLMGSAGYVAPLANITRAEAAKMCVVYQPEKTSTDFTPTK